uniref:DNA repair protein SWI5 homolog n=1 Tax=Theropithecus gelada TaxID=9565 RepID=A0A8D2FR49_THEGE
LLTALPQTFPFQKSPPKTPIQCFRQPPPQNAPFLEGLYPDPGSISAPFPDGFSPRRSYFPAAPPPASPQYPCPHSGLWVQSGFPLGFLSRTEPGLTRSCRGAFRSPRPSPKSGQADGTSEESLHLDIQKLKEKRDMLDEEISQFISEGYSVDELEDHITQLHEYNDIKDVGQMLMGKLAVIRGVTTKELYPEFGLDMND